MEGDGYLNATLICELNAPTASPPSEPFRSLQATINILAVLFILTSSAYYLHVSSRRERLKLRGLNTIIIGSLVTTAILAQRAYYGIVGREYMGCAASISMVYLFCMLNIVMDCTEAACYLSKRQIREDVIDRNMRGMIGTSNYNVAKKRQVQTGITAMVQNSSRVGNSSGGGAMPKTSVEVTIHDNAQSESAPELGAESSSHGASDNSYRCWPRNIATPLEWFKGCYNLVVSNMYLASCYQTGKNTTQKLRFAPSKRLKVSKFRELSYDFVNWTIWASPLAYIMAVVTTVIPRYRDELRCRGCQMDLTDILVFYATAMFTAGTMIVLFYRMRMEDDPLHVINDIIFAYVVYFSFTIVSYSLVVADPGELMRSQQVDWYIIETVAAVIMHYRRCVLQILRANRVHAKPTIPLLTVLNHKEMSVLFERHLGRELASENLLFWREAVKYKLGFEADFDYSQELGKIIIQQFIGKRAQLEINISDKQANGIMAKAKAGVLGKSIFDEAMVEVFHLMESGPYVRFLRSKEFAAYANSAAADFSLLQIEDGRGATRIQNTSQIGSNGGSNLGNSGGMVRASNLAEEDKKFAVGDWVRRL